MYTYHASSSESNLCHLLVIIIFLEQGVTQEDSALVDELFHRHTLRCKFILLEPNYLKSLMTRFAFCLSMYAMPCCKSLFFHSLIRSFIAPSMIYLGKKKRKRGKKKTNMSTKGK